MNQEHQEEIKKYQDHIEKHREEIVTYLDRHSSKEDPKSIDEIAETLSMDMETVGMVIHYLLASNVLGIEKSPDKYSFRYYLIHKHQHIKH